MDFKSISVASTNSKSDIDALEQMLADARKKAVKVDLARIAAEIGSTAIENAVKKIKLCDIPIDEYKAHILSLFDVVPDQNMLPETEEIIQPHLEVEIQNISEPEADPGDDIKLGVEEQDHALNDGFEECEVLSANEKEDEAFLEYHLAQSEDEEILENLPKTEIAEEPVNDVKTEIKKPLAVEKIDKQLEVEVQTESNINQLAENIFYETDNGKGTVILYIGDKAKLRLRSWGDYVIGSLNVRGNKNWISYNIDDPVYNVNWKYELTIKGMTLEQATQLAGLKLNEFPPEDENEKLISPAKSDTPNQDAPVVLQVGEKVASTLAPSWVYEVTFFDPSEPKTFVGRRVGQPNAPAINLAVNQVRRLDAE